MPPTALTFRCLSLVFLAALAVCGACSRQSEGVGSAVVSSEVTTRGSIEVTAELVEVPDGAIFKRDLYNYATILKYKVLQVHRGTVDGEYLYVGHYNPWKPRSEAADDGVSDVGGSLRSFRAGQRHRMALEVPIDDYFMGGIVNKYFGQETGPLYWAVWTESQDE
jgi:hypothetical protein